MRKQEHSLWHGSPNELQYLNKNILSNGLHVHDSPNELQYLNKNILSPTW